jgi:microcystin-dependent protein
MSAITNDINYGLNSMYYDTAKPPGGNLIFAGMIMPYAGLTAPPGWMICDGRSLITTDYPELFASIGYNFGGSGTNFNLPDCRSKVVRGSQVNTSADVGVVGGADSITLLAGTTMPSHNHNVIDPGHIHTAPTQNQDGTGGLIDNTPSLFNFTPGNPTAQALTNITLGATGGSPTQPISLIQPYIALNYVIRITNAGLINFETAGPVVPTITGPLETVYIYALYTQVGLDPPNWYWCDASANMEPTPVLIVNYTGSTGERDNITYNIPGSFSLPLIPSPPPSPPPMP